MSNFLISSKLIGVKNYHCKTCNREFETYFLEHDETCGPHLMACENCNKIYIYTDENEYLRGKLEVIITGLHCENCNAELSKTLKPYKKSEICLSEKHDVKLLASLRGQERDISDLYSVLVKGA